MTSLLIGRMLWTSAVTNIILSLPLIIHHEVTADDFNDVIQNDPDYGKKWMFIPDDKGNAQIAYLVDPGPAAKDAEVVNSYRKSANDGIIYHLYRQKFKSESVQFRMMDRSYQRVLNNRSNYDPDLETKMIIHGWKNTYKSPMPQKIKDAYLNQEDMNVIVVDWGGMADDTYYFNSADSTKVVGQTNARLLDYLVGRETFAEDIHLIGHSLGAHCAGYTGAAMRSGKPERITGLDPAKPAFSDVSEDQRLDPSDAGFVDVIHTCAGTLGYDKSLGHVDFWPNGGRMAQPGCSSIIDIVGGCSHGRSYEFFIDSIDSELPFLAYPCESYENFKNGKCNNHAVEMGDATPSDARGSYYLKTRPKRPYPLFW